MQRATDEDDVIVVDGADALGRMLLDRFRTPLLLALPISERGDRFGVLLVAITGALPLDELGVARAYGRAAAACGRRGRPAAARWWRAGSARLV